VPRGLLQQQHRDRIGLLAGSAARDPYSDQMVGRLGLKQPRDDLALERLERLLVTEKGRYRNEQVPQEGLRLIGVVAQQVVVGVRIVGPGDLHAAREPAQNGRALVLREVMPGPNAHMGEDAPQQLLIEMAHLSVRVLFMDQLSQTPRELAHRQDEIRNPRRDCAAGHRGIFSLVGVLHQDDAAGFLDRSHPDRAIGPGAGQNDGATVAMMFRQ